MRKLPINRLKKKAWKVTSNHVRKNAADKDGLVACVTCGARNHWKNMHAGHYIHGHSKPTFLVVENVHPQCVRCNHFLSGNLLEYNDFMLKKYGQGKVEELRKLSKQVIKYDRSYYELIIEMYKDSEKEKSDV